MSSGGGKNTTTTTSTQLPAWAQAYQQYGIDRAMGIVNRPYQGYEGPRIADFTPDQYAGFDQIRNQANQAGQLTNTGDQYVQNTLNGYNDFTPQQNQYQGAQNQYAGQNPYLNQMVADAQGDVTRQYQQSVVPNMLTQFNSGGAFGGTAMQQAMSQSNQDLAGQLGRVSTNLRNADYDRQAQLAESGLNRNAQLADSYLGRQQDAWRQGQANRQIAAGMIPGLNESRYGAGKALGAIGAQQQGLLQNALDIGYGDFVEQRDWDKNNMSLLQNGISALTGGNQVQTSNGANPNYQSAAQNAAGYAATAAALAKLWGNSGWGWGGV